LKKANAAGIVVSMLDEVAWLFNLRGSDIIYNPVRLSPLPLSSPRSHKSLPQVFFSYAIITPTTTTLYIRPESLTSSTRAHLSANEITVKPYTEIWTDLTSLGKSVESALTDGPVKKADESGREKTEDILRKIEGCGGKVMVGSHTSWAVALALGEVSLHSHLWAGIRS
jgi:Xaa-Pro aminopeptidase